MVYYIQDMENVDFSTSSTNILVGNLVYNIICVSFSVCARTRESIYVPTNIIFYVLYFW